MFTRRTNWLVGVAVLVALFGTVAPAFAQKAPDGFRVELIYSAPDIEHPSVVACDDAGNLFVGEDPMDMRGPSTKEFDRVLYLRWGEAGQPPRKTVFCQNLSAVFGLLWHDGALYVMHAPHFSRFRDTDGDGVADERTDLAEGFGPAAGVFGFNDHIVSGIRVGLDGLVYVSVGDKGIQKAVGSDGSTITLEGGGVVRMRLDGSQLEVFSSGTRNHLDVAMDSLDNIFTYDNTDDGNGWWTRFTHHVADGYYGYPYDYQQHAERHLPCISDHGGGSPTGAACYREAAWPAEYRDNVFCCEWGKAKVQRFKTRRNGASFTAEVSDFLTQDDGGEFRPADLCFSPDGRSMYVADWNYGGWLKPESRGRLFRVTYAREGSEAKQQPQAGYAWVDELLAALGSASHSQRVDAQNRLVSLGPPAIKPLEVLLCGSAGKSAKVYAIWALNGLVDKVSGYDAANVWTAALTDPDADVRAQGARALGYRRSAVALDALIAALEDDDPAVRMQAAHALGRIGDRKAAVPLWNALGEKDTFARFTVIRSLRRLNDWRPAREAFATAGSDVQRSAIVAMTGIYDAGAVDMLRHVASEATDPAIRVQALNALAEVHRRADPYTSGWWGTQPAKSSPARPKVHAWEESDTILATIAGALKQPSAEVRTAAVRLLPGVEDAEASATLQVVARDDSDDGVRIAAIQQLAELKDKSATETLVRLASATDSRLSVKKESVRALAVIGSAQSAGTLADLLRSSGSDEDLAGLCLEALGSIGASDTAPVVEPFLTHTSIGLRIAAIEAYAKIRKADAAEQIIARLEDDAPVVQQAAAKKLGELRAKSAIEPLILAASKEAARFEAIVALAAMPDPRALAVFLGGLNEKSSELRDASRRAITALQEQVGDTILELARRNELSAGVRRQLQAIFAAPRPILNWQVAGPWPKDQRPQFDLTTAPALEARFEVGGRRLRWREIKTADPMGRLSFSGRIRPQDDVWVVAYTAIESSQAVSSRAIVGSDDQLVLYVNGKQVYEHKDSRAWSADQGDVEIELAKGVNHIWAYSGNDSCPWEMSGRMALEDPRFAILGEQLPMQLEPAAYRDFVLKNPGDAERGRALFTDPKGVGCVKCHAIAGQGGTVGPDLAGIGSRYPREELIRSVLEPSNRILSGYELTVVVTTQGTVIQGIVKRRGDDGLDLVDAEGRAIHVHRDEIDEEQSTGLSMMPNGLKDGLSLEDFSDLIAHLESLKEAPAAGAGSQ